MDKQRGFTLIELMVVIGIIAILSAIGIPAYQNYLRKAALTDVLQTFIPYRTAVELCALEHGGLAVRVGARRINHLRRRQQRHSRARHHALRFRPDCGSRRRHA